MSRLIRSRIGSRGDEGIASATTVASSFTAANTSPSTTTNATGSTPVCQDIPVPRP